MDDTQPYSIDIELLRPAFGDQGFAGVDVPSTDRSGTVRYGTVLQYEQAPLTIYEAVEHVELGAVVTNRFSAMAGASTDVQRTTFSVLVPTALNWGTELELFGAEPLPEYPGFQTLPWNGLVVPVIEPTVVAPPEPASEEEEFP